MRKDQLQRHRQALLELLDRVTSEVNHVVESLQAETAVTEGESFAPVHLADFTSKAADADVRILQTERDIRGQIRAALQRLDSGAFGKCQTCGAAIAQERLEALPYASKCAACASSENSRTSEAETPTGTIRLTGFEAIEFAEKAGLTLNKAADSIDEFVTGLSIAEAEALADDDAELIWLEVAADEYYGHPRTMEPGAAPSPARRRRAGQRGDELAPGEDSGSAGGRSAIGTPGGGLASGGMAGTNAPDAGPEGSELEEAMASGRGDHSGDRVSTDEPQSGRAGGAVGGTPAGKRTRGK